MESTGITDIPDFPDANLVTNWTWAFAAMGTVNMPATELDMSAMTNGTLCFSGTTLPTSDYDDLLEYLEAYNTNSSVVFHGGNSLYTIGGAGEDAYNYLVDIKLWDITDGRNP